MIQDVISRLKAVTVSAANKVVLSYTDSLVVVTVFTGPLSVFSIVVTEAIALDGITLDSAPDTKAKLDEATKGMEAVGAEPAP